MTTPGAADAGSGSPELPAAPTVRVDRPPVPRRAAPSPTAPPTTAPPTTGPATTGPPATKPAEPAPPRTLLDETTVTLPDRDPGVRHGTLRFGTPAPVKVTVGPRVRPRRRHRTWPWIAGLVAVLLVLGAVLLVMLWRGATIDPDVDLVGVGALAPWTA